MLWEKNVKKLQLLEQKIAFSKRKYSSTYKLPPNISPQEKFFEKALLTKNKHRGVISEFYGISVCVLLHNELGAFWCTIIRTSSKNTL